MASPMLGTLDVALHKDVFTFAESLMAKMSLYRRTGGRRFAVCGGSTAVKRRLPDTVPGSERKTEREHAAVSDKLKTLLSVLKFLLVHQGQLLINGFAISHGQDRERNDIEKQTKFVFVEF